MRCWRNGACSAWLPRTLENGEDTVRTIVSHALIAGAAAAVTYVIAIYGQPMLAPSTAQAHAPAAPTGQRVAEVFNQAMADVSGRVLSVRLTERDPGNGSPAHRHPGSHTVGYILEGTYEVKIDDGPVRTLKPGEVFYEAPNALHAVSRNASTTQALKYLVIQVSDPSKPATVPE
jgi:quercetin dioxygenase-like cupin family protein